MHQHTSEVLVVDTNPDGVELYATALALAGISSVTASSATEALDRIESDRPRALVTGLRLHGTTASSLIHRVRQAIPPSELFVVGLASSEDHASREAAAECDLVLPVPCLPETLVSELRRALA